MATRRRPGPTDQDRALLAELEAVWQDADTLYAGHSCPRATECCRFAITGREPYVTTIEVLAIVRAVAARGGPLRNRRRAAPLPPHPSRRAERTCPLLDEQGRCAVYGARPLGCRSFFCRRADRDRPIRQAEVRALVHRVQDIAARHVPDGDRGRPLTRALRLHGLA